ncbi:MAG: class I SAM-dependent methyltransferase [Pikeienuella sp.]
MKTPPTKSLLHVGCGSSTINNLPRFFHQGWSETRLDIAPSAKPDIMMSMTDMGSITDRFDAIWSSHNIEHLHDAELGGVLTSMRKLLNPGGWVVITCPDIATALQLGFIHGLDHVWYRSPAGPITIRDVIFGHQRSIVGGHTFMAHKNGLTLESLCAKLKTAGFPMIFGEKRRRDLWFIAGDFKTSEQAAAKLHEVQK